MSESQSGATWWTKEVNELASELRLLEPETGVRLGPLGSRIFARALLERYHMERRTEGESGGGNKE